jgi:hypothetical protein
MNTAMRRLILFLWCGLLTAPLTALLGADSAANSAPAIIDIAIVEPIGRPEHQGFFPIQGQPIVGSIVFVRSRMDSAANGLGINLRDSSGNLFGQVPMVAPSPTWPSGTYIAQFQVPTIPFALSVSGTDQSGNNFELAPPGQPHIISPQTTALRLVPTIAEPPPDTPLYVTVQATNFAASNTFNLSLTSDDANATISPANVSLAVGANQTAFTQFQLVLPADASGTTILTATATAPGGIGNTAMLELPIATEPADQLLAWIHPNDKKDLMHPDQNNLLNIWVCDTGVDGNSIVIGNVLPPTIVQHLNVEPRDKMICSAPLAFELSFTVPDLVTNLTAMGLTSSGTIIQMPVSGFDTTGTPLIGYVPVQF